jgi:hypothetical protein
MPTQAVERKGRGRGRLFCSNGDVLTTYAGTFFALRYCSTLACIFSDGSAFGLVPFPIGLLALRAAILGRIAPATPLHSRPLAPRLVACDAELDRFGTDDIVTHEHIAVVAADTDDLPALPTA